jgi:hypothetical protein
MESCRYVFVPSFSSDCDINIGVFGLFAQASRRSVRFHTRGGQELSRFSKLDAALDASFNMPAYQHHIDRKPHFTAAQTMENGASMVLAATNSLHTSPALVSVDLNTQQVLQLVRFSSSLPCVVILSHSLLLDCLIQVSVEQRVSCFSGLRNLLCSGTENGALEIRDPRAPQLRPQNGTPHFPHSSFPCFGIQFFLCQSGSHRGAHGRCG